MRCPERHAGPEGEVQEAAKPERPALRPHPEISEIGEGSAEHDSAAVEAECIAFSENESARQAAAGRR